MAPTAGQRLIAHYGKVRLLEAGLHQVAGAGDERPRVLIAVNQTVGYRGRYPHHDLSSSDGFVRFVEAGFGYGMLPVQQCDLALAAGRLVDLMPGRYLDVALVWHAWDLQTPFTRILSDNVIATARRWLLQS